MNAGRFADYADRLLARAGLEPGLDHPAEPASAPTAEPPVPGLDPFEAEPLPAAVLEPASSPPVGAPPAVAPQRIVLPALAERAEESLPFVAPTRAPRPPLRVATAPGPLSATSGQVPQRPPEPVPMEQAGPPGPALTPGAADPGHRPSVESAGMPLVPARPIDEPERAAVPVLQPPAVAAEPAQPAPAPKTPASPSVRELPQPAPRSDAPARVASVARLEIGRIEVEIVPAAPAPGVTPARPIPTARTARTGGGPARLVSRFGLGSF